MLGEAKSFGVSRAANADALANSIGLISSNAEFARGVAASTVSAIIELHDDIGSLGMPQSALNLAILSPLAVTITGHPSITEWSFQIG